MKNFGKNLINLSKPLIQTRNFMFSSRQTNQIQQDIQEILNENLIDEKKTMIKDQENINFIQDNEFEIIDKDQELELKFIKKQGDYSVIASFFQKLDQENLNSDQEKQDFFDFQVDIVKDNQGLSFNCTYLNQQYDILYLSIFQDYDQFKLKNYQQRQLQNYCGPDFETLDDSLKNEFYVYIENFGINKDLVDAMEKYAIEKEYELYIQWKEKMIEFMKG